MKVAWIGLGQMGLPTAKAVAAGGHDVRAFDVKAPAAEDAQGLTLVGSPREAAQGADLGSSSLRPAQASPGRCGHQGSGIDSSDRWPGRPVEAAILAGSR